MKNVDTTKNRSGVGNMMPLSTPKPCGTQNLVDGFIKDGWLPPESRSNEIISLYQNQMAALHREKCAIIDEMVRQYYSTHWVDYFLHYWATTRQNLKDN